MAQYMKNRSGVVFYLDHGLLENQSLGFTRCDVNGKDVAPVAQEPATEEAPKKRSRRKAK